MTGWVSVFAKAFVQVMQLGIMRRDRLLTRLWMIAEAMSVTLCSLLQP